MSENLQYFHFTLDPVQSFVAQARRTRDFCGYRSHAPALIFIHNFVQESSYRQGCRYPVPWITAIKLRLDSPFSLREKVRMRGSNKAFFLIFILLTPALSSRRGSFNGSDAEAWERCGYLDRFISATPTGVRIL